MDCTSIIVKDDKTYNNYDYLYYNWYHYYDYCFYHFNHRKTIGYGVRDSFLNSTLLQIVDHKT